ncbi:MAG TPA: nucleoside phosphorylase [Prolixibacteraceae bacterium]|nr:nucleoside phosphorylase [Prolixibacteraceae bacterium]HPS14029.1 nucleoside phosphorylase [Prolixibacteraceae bacterium]
MIKSSELIINPDGSVFHLHLKPENIAKTILMVGDPGRIEMIASFFDKIECEVYNREFKTVTGWYKNQRLSVVSTGIGTDNIDIVVNELDALVNIDLKTREIKPEKTSLNLIRIGTSGSLHADIPINAYVVSKKSVGFDGLLNFYQGRNEIADLPFEKAFMEHTQWNELLAKPYVIDCSEKLYHLISSSETVDGINISAPGFYGPQGRVIRLPIEDPELNQKIESFRFEGQKITNYEMESSAIYGLSKLLGHEALTICVIIANRVTLEANENYIPSMRKLVEYILEHLVKGDRPE